MDIVQMKNITKTFGKVVANDGVDFSVRKGEIHSLLGENGAGKTTMMRMLYGMIPPDSGEIYLNGERVELRSPKDAIEHGISMVQQLAFTVPIEDSIRIQTRSIMGTEIPYVKYDAKQNDLTYSFSTTYESIDIVREAFRDVKELTIKLSMVENAAYRLATNIKKTQKRANALKNITIPMYSNLVYTITNALEEKEREEFTRLKVIKRNKTSA